MNILVTGGGGFIGLALVRRLIEAGHELSSFSRNVYSEHHQLGVKTMCGDLTNLKDTMKACQGMEAVFHVAAKVGVSGSYAEFYRANVSGTQNIVHSCLSQGVHKLIFTSSASVIFGGSNLEGVDETVAYPGLPVSHYTSTKAEAEQEVLNVNCEQLKTISLRPHLVWGPGDTQLIPKILKRARSGKLRKPGRGDYLIDTTYIDNLIDAQLLALENLAESQEICGRAFFISNGEPVLTWDFLNAIIEAAGLSPVHKTVSKSAALFVAWCLELIYRLPGMKGEPFISRFLIQELCTSHWFDISAARTLLGYTPRINMEEGLKRLGHDIDRVGVMFFSK